MGDWFLYEKHTELRIFGSNLLPYKLPKYLTIRVFALEYLRQVLNYDAINFMASKKKTQFNIKKQIGPFIVNNREANKEIEKTLSELKFQVSFPWNYDPQGFLSIIRVKCKLPPFIHEPKPDIEKFENQTKWLENTLIDTVINAEPTQKMDTTLAMVASKEPESLN